MVWGSSWETSHFAVYSNLCRSADDLDDSCRVFVDLQMIETTRLESMMWLVWCDLSSRFMAIVVLETLLILPYTAICVHCWDESSRVRDMIWVGFWMYGMRCMGHAILLYIIIWVDLHIVEMTRLSSSWHDFSDMARVRDIRHEIFRETLLHIHLYSPICVEPQIIETNLLEFWSWYDSSAWLK